MIMMNLSSKSENLKCPKCGRDMVCYMDTCLCPIDDWEQLWYLAAYTKYDIENIKGEKT